MKLSELNQKELKEQMTKLFIYAKSLSKHHQEAEDLASRTLEKALERENQFDGKNLNAWLKTIMLNTFRDNLRKNKPDSFSDLDIDDPSVDETASTETEAIMSDLEKCLEPFSERDKEIFRLLAMEFSMDEIAEQLDLSSSNVRQIRFRKSPDLYNCLESKAA